MGDDSKLNDGRWIDGSSVGFFAYTAHPGLFGLFSNGQLILDVVAIGCHLLDGNVLVCDAVFGSGVGGGDRGCAGAALAGFGHGCAVLGLYGCATCIGAIHGMQEQYQLGGLQRQAGANGERM